MAGGACMAGGHAWQGGMRGWGVCMPCTLPPARYYEIRSVNERAVRILLECILVVFFQVRTADRLEEYSHVETVYQQ